MDPVLPEVVGLALDEPLGIHQSEIPDVGFLCGDQLSEDHDFRFGAEHHRRRMDLDLLARVQLNM